MAYNRIAVNRESVAAKRDSAGVVKESTSRKKNQMT